MDCMFLEQMCELRTVLFLTGQGHICLVLSIPHIPVLLISLFWIWTILRFGEPDCWLSSSSSLKEVVIARKLSLLDLLVRKLDKSGQRGLEICAELNCQCDGLLLIWI